MDQQRSGDTDSSFVKRLEARPTIVSSHCDIWIEKRIFLGRSTLTRFGPKLTTSTETKVPRWYDPQDPTIRQFSWPPFPVVGNDHYCFEQLGLHESGSCLNGRLLFSPVNYDCAV